MKVKVRPRMMELPTPTDGKQNLISLSHFQTPPLSSNLFICGVSTQIYKSILSFLPSFFEKAQRSI